MRAFKIFLLHFEGIFEHRFRSLVWFIIPLTNMLPMLMFWTIAIKSGQTDIDWSYQSMNTYYLSLIIAITMLSSHVDEEVGDIDIKGGELVKYLIKPFPYYWIKFFEEVPYRVLQGSYGIILFSLFFIFFKQFIFVDFNYINVLLGMCSAVIAYFISFTFQLIIGYSAFWLTESRVLSEILFIIKIIFAGQIVPLSLFPVALAKIAYVLPFASMIYYPVIIFLGRVGPQESLRLIIVQALWLTALLVLSRIMWNKGVKKFSAIGQ